MILAFLLSLSGAEQDDGVPSAVPVALTAPERENGDLLPPGTTAPVTSDEGLGEGFADDVDGRTPLRGFSQVAATITGEDGTVCEVCLLAAETDEQRARGLMEVTDAELGGYDGMLFVYPDEVAGSFWMRNTPLPLSIAYFTGEGELVSTVDMEPCDDVDSCPNYPPDGPFRLALEVPQGELAAVGVIGEATIELGGRTCPRVASGG